MNYWWALVLAPIVVGAFGILLERVLIARLYKLDHLYGLLLTFGMALIIQGLFRNYYGVFGAALRDPAGTVGRPAPAVHVPAELPRLGRSSPRSPCAWPPGS